MPAISKLIPRILHTLALIALATASCRAQKLELNLVTPKLIQQRLESGAVRPAERQNTIRQLFKDLDCPVEEQPVDKKSSNVICTLPGETSSEIVVGGHFDFADEGKGIVDDWSGTSLLPSLYQALKDKPRRHTYVFVAFAAEERGLIGSSKYVKRLTKEQKETIRAFVNLECLGVSPVKVWTHRSTPELVSRLGEIARAVDITLEGVNVEKVGEDDTHPFLNAKIPVITIHSITQETLPILHSARDQLAAINSADYYNAYRLVAFFLAYLDLKME